MCTFGERTVDVVTMAEGEDESSWQALPAAPPTINRVN
jgi:hypothetical protein